MDFSNRNLGSSISVVFGFLLLLLLPFDLLLKPLGVNEFKQEFLGDAIKNLVIVVYGYLLIRYHNYGRISGSLMGAPRNSWLFVIPVYFLALGPLEYYFLGYEFGGIQWQDVLLLLFSMLTVGWSEEIIFRGFVLPHLISGSAENQPLIGPLFLGAVMFGVLHFFNLLQPDASFILILSQVTYATMFGVAFGVLLLRAQCLWPLGLLHGLINFFSNWDELPGAKEPANLEAYRPYEALIAILVVVPFVLFALKQLKKVDRKAILAQFDQQEP